MADEGSREGEGQGGMKGIMTTIRSGILPLSLLLAASLPITAQFYPQDSQVISYFPQLVDGGPVNVRWMTSLIFVNPHQKSVAMAVAYFYDDNGQPLMLDFGSGPASTLNFTVPAQGTVVFKSAATSSTNVSGWAIVLSSLPLQGVVQYTLSSGGGSQQNISVQATQASHLFRSPATYWSGIAIANPNSASIVLNVTALDPSGTNIAQQSLTVPPLGHRAFNLSGVFPALPASFQGSVVVTTPSTSDFVVMTLSSDGRAISNYPPSGLNWPASQYELIWKVWLEVLAAANGITPINPKLVIDYDTSTINSYANPSANEVHIFLNLAELISDSESELAFVIGHELGHIIQAKVGLQLVPSNSEQDADQWGMLLGLEAGYDPYGAAGALAKLSMASGNAGLLNQNFDNLLAQVGADLHGSFDNRLALIFQNMQMLCATPQLQSFCSQYKTLVHPHLPSIAPLVAYPVKGRGSTK